MANLTIRINGKQQTVNVDEDTPLLWVLREDLQMTGTKYGCGIGQCGTCTIHIDDVPIKSCTLPVSAVANGQSVTTIEGLSEDGSHPVQKAWVEAQVPQCGYCQSGQIMQAAALLKMNAKPTRAEILKYMNGNLCRCGTYMRVLKAIQMAAKEEVIGMNE